ncbi:hypothetical protein GH714_024367 [Hevea brasiliensis]|uniref:alanine transaminase n=2 Tax=Hevea brasiliensis TaxID=3981 RepID=A0A6A6M2J9_HEVBR|nr:hypothetical protein GH714_024367 [Hevea brasiliensis]
MACFHSNVLQWNFQIIFTNVGNPHALGQKPLTFPRQVVALCQAPFLLDDPNVGLIFPADAIARAKHYLSLTSGGLGAYSDSRGIPGIRKEVAEFIGRRDGYPSDPELIFLTDGASKGVMQILNTIIRGDGDGVLVPVPQYPLYSAAISLFGGSLVPYYLEETANWGLDINDLRHAVFQARSKGITVRAMVIINPGNPTGQCLSEANLREILHFCYQENLALLGDEVYQQNIYQDERPFISARKVLMDMGPPISKEIQLVSFHTVSKGYWGECGQRGGYFEMTNIPAQTVDEIYKVASISLSPNVPAQIFMGLMVNPPKPGDISYEHLLGRGAMYSFPQIRLPPKAIEAAKKAGKVPDVFYCLKLLEATGISTVPGSGFGQKEGVFHLRTTILPSEEDMPAIMASFKKFNDEFMEEHEDHRGYSRMVFFVSSIQSMGFSEKPQVDSGLELDSKKWVIAGIPLRAPLKPIFTNPVEKESETDECSTTTTTPTSEDARIPTRLTCPPAPKKRKATLKCSYSGVREFFTPPDLETVYIRHVERAK